MDVKLKLKQISQVDLTTTSATALVTPPSRTRYVVNMICITNYAKASVAFTLYHDADGTTYTNATSVYHTHTNDSVILTFPQGDGFVVDNPGNLAAMCNTANSICVTTYGTEIQYNKHA